MYEIVSMYKVEEIEDYNLSFLWGANSMLGELHLHPVFTNREWAELYGELIYHQPNLT